MNQACFFSIPRSRAVCGFNTTTTLIPVTKYRECVCVCVCGGGYTKISAHLSMCPGLCLEDTFRTTLPFYGNQTCLIVWLPKFQLFMHGRTFESKNVFNFTRQKK